MKVLRILIPIISFALTANAQEQKEFFIVDTLAPRLSLAQPEWTFSRDTILLPQSTRLLYGDRSDLLLQPHGALAERQSWMFTGKTDLLSPWKLELRDQEKYRTWRNILGSIQMSGAAYLGYLYIKKHGLK